MNNYYLRINMIPIHDINVVNELTKKAFINKDENAHKELTQMGYEAHSEFAYSVHREITRIGYYHGSVIPGKTESVYFVQRNSVIK